MHAASFAHGSRRMANGRNGSKADIREVWLAPSRRVTAARAVAVFGRPATMCRITMPMRRRCKLLLHQRAAAAVTHDLPVAHAVARADGAAREMRRACRPMGPVTGMRAPMVRPRGAMMLPAPAMVARVDPAVARARLRHRREGRRERLGLACRRRLHIVRNWLLKRSGRLVGLRLLRPKGR